MRTRWCAMVVAALLLLAWWYERRVRRETGMLRFEAEPMPEWHPQWQDGTAVCNWWEGETL